MTWGAVAIGGATILSGYMTAQQKAAADAKANKENRDLETEGNQLTWEQTQAQLREGGRQFDLSREDKFRGAEQNLGRLDPYSRSGAAATEERSALLGLSGKEAQAEAFSRFSESPGQSFLRERQQRALLRSSSAIGGLGGGNVRTALQEQAFQRAQTDYDKQLDRLGGASDQGLGAAALAASTGPTGLSEDELAKQRYGYTSPETADYEGADTPGTPNTTFVPPDSTDYRYGQGGGDEDRGGLGDDDDEGSQWA